MRCRATATPILFGRAVHGFLRSGDGVHCGHQAFYNAKLIMNDLGKRRKAVGGAACIGNHVHFLFISVMVYAHYEHRRIGRRSRNYHLLGAALKVLGSFLRGRIDAR